ncbi:MAG TPA: HK97 family phage prohead protease [Gemmatimonadaceae bacterium]
MANRESVALTEWKAAAAAGTAPSDVVLHKAFAAEVRAPDGSGDPAPVVDFVISTAAVDRDRDVIAVDGWDLAAYRRNPVVLWAHSRRDLPIGRALDVHIDGSSLVSRAEFASADLNPFAGQVYRMLRAGFLNAVSVGFVPQEWTWDEQRGGVNFLRQELVEFSVVPVPANPEALMIGRMPEEDRAALRAWAERTLDWVNEEPGLWLPREKVERVLSLLDNERTVHPVPDPVAPVERDVDTSPFDEFATRMETIAEELKAKLGELASATHGVPAPMPDPVPDVAPAPAESVERAVLTPNEIAEAVRAAVQAEVARITGRLD